MWLLLDHNMYHFNEQHNMQVGFAVEFEVMSEDSDRSDLFGHAISLDGGLLLAGAPKKHREVPEVQLIVSAGTASEVSDRGVDHAVKYRVLQ